MPTARSVVVDAPVFVAAINEWPNGVPASLLRACVDGRIVLLLSDRFLTVLHELFDDGYIRPEYAERFQTLLGLLQGRAVWHDDTQDESELPWPEYLNSLAIENRAVAIITNDPDVTGRASAAPPFSPDDLPPWLMT